MNHYNAGSTERSVPHRRMEKILDEAGLNYLSEEKFMPFQVDILLPEFWVAIEIDGPFHLKKRDRIRDQYLLETYELPVIRFNAVMLDSMKHKEELLEKIIEFIDQYAETAESRKHKCQTRL